jgi:hypothetical protein
MSPHGTRGSENGYADNWHFRKLRTIFSVLTIGLKTIPRILTKTAIFQNSAPRLFWRKWIWQNDHGRMMGDQDS